MKNIIWNHDDDDVVVVDIVIVVVDVVDINVVVVDVVVVILNYQVSLNEQKTTLNFSVNYRVIYSVQPVQRSIVHDKCRTSLRNL